MRAKVPTGWRSTQRTCFGYWLSGRSSTSWMILASMDRPIRWSVSNSMPCTPPWYCTMRYWTPAASQSAFIAPTDFGLCEKRLLVLRPMELTPFCAGSRVCRQLATTPATFVHACLSADFGAPFSGISLMVIW